MHACQSQEPLNTDTNEELLERQNKNENIQKIELARAFISNMSRNGGLCSTCPPRFSISTCPQQKIDKKPFLIPGAFNHQPGAFNHQPTCAHVPNLKESEIDLSL